MTAAIIYTRFSPRPNAQECDSCEKQEERCRAYCEKMGYDFLNDGNEREPIFSDEAVTGSVFEREGLTAALEEISILREDFGRSEIVLVVDSVDRLSRDMLVTLMIRHEVEKRGARIEYANGTQTPDTPEGKLFSNILAAFAAYERDRVKYATSRGIKKRQSNGEWFGKPPIGWMRDPENSKKLIECHHELDAIKYIKTLAPMYTSSIIAKKVTEDFGLFRGKPWSARTVRRIIAREEWVK